MQQHSVEMQAAIAADAAAQRAAEQQAAVTVGGWRQQVGVGLVHQAEEARQAARAAEQRLRDARAALKAHEEGVDPQTAASDDELEVWGMRGAALEQMAKRRERELAEAQQRAVETADALRRALIEVGRRSHEEAVQAWRAAVHSSDREIEALQAEIAKLQQRAMQEQGRAGQEITRVRNALAALGFDRSRLGTHEEMASRSRSPLW